MIHKAKLLGFLFLICLNVDGQEIPTLKFNHLSFSIEYKDLKALRESAFIKDSLAVLETRTYEDEGQPPATVNFLYGRSNYLELFETSEDDPILGFLTLVFGVDKINGLNELQSFLKQTYYTNISSREREHDTVNIPWFDAMVVIDTTILDSTFMAESHFWFWVMNYKTEYFEHNHYTIENNELTREHYLERFEPERKNKIVKSFSGLVIKLNPAEKEYLTKFFNTMGYNKLGENEYISPGNFRYLIEERKPEDKYSLKSIRFETSREFVYEKIVHVSDHITIEIQGDEGQIVFN